VSTDLNVEIDAELRTAKANGSNNFELLCLEGSRGDTIDDEQLSIERISIFLNPEQNRAATYNIEQALIAIGGGGWMGQGWAHGSQNQLHFLRVRHTDFIFSVIAEELGLIGTNDRCQRCRITRVTDRCRPEAAARCSGGIAPEQTVA